MVESFPRVETRLIVRQGNSFSRACASCASRLNHTFLLLVAAAAVGIAVPASMAKAAFDHNHSAFDTMLQQHVVLISEGTSSQVDYAAFQRERAQLQAYLSGLATVTPQEYAAFSKAEQLAFLINAYNAYTIDFILTRYPDIESIKDLGSLFSNAWSKRLFPLLGKKRTLDEIEHEMIRKPGDFDDPRIHMAVNCAAIGCPALRPEAYVAPRLDAQLDDAVERFLRDRSRNRAEQKVLRVSKIFDWYAEDFAKHSGSVAAWLAPYATQLSDEPRIQDAVAAGALRVRYLDYDWALNDLRRLN
jgi:Protein of unknown function, DUF547